MADNADIVVNFTDAVDNALATTTNLNGSTSNASGITASWSLSRASQHSRIIVSSALPLLESLICNGVAYTATNGKALEYDLDDAAIHGWEQQSLNFGTNSLQDISLGAMTTMAVDVGNDNDTFTLTHGGNYGITQFREEPPASGRMVFNAHGQVGVTTTRGAPVLADNTPGTLYWISHRRNYSEGSVEVVIQNGTTGAFVGCSRVLTTTVTSLSTFTIGTYLAPVGGTFKHSIIALAFGAKATLPLLPGAFVLPPPPSVIAIDNDSDVSVYFGLAFGDTTANSLAFGYRIERSDDLGATWDVLESNLVVPFDNTLVSPYVDATASPGVKYGYRIASLLHSWTSVPAYSNYIMHGAAVWYDSVDPLITDTTADHGDSSYDYSVLITLPEGTASKLRVYIKSSFGSDVAFKVALYSTVDGSLLVSATGSIPASSSDIWKEFIIPPTDVAAGPYRVAWGADANGSQVQYRYKNLSGQTDISTQTFVSFPNDPFIAPFSHLNGANAAGVHVMPPDPAVLIDGAPIF